MSSPNPPKILEKLVSALLPPACRENVLGDLWERYRSNWQYLGEALLILPLLVVSRIRRMADAQMLLIEAFAVYLSFVAAGWQFYGSSFLYDHSGFLRLAVPAMVTFGILLLFDVYCNRVTDKLPTVQGAVAAAGTVLSFLFLLAFIPPLRLTMGMLFAGGLSSVLLVSGLRGVPQLGVLRRLQQLMERRAVDPIHMSPEEIRAAAIRVHKRAWVARIAVCAGMGLSAMGWAFGIWLAPSLLYRVGSGLSLAGLVYSVYVLQKGFSRGRLQSNPSLAMCIEFYRSNLEGRRDLLRHAWPRLLGPVLAGTLIVLATDPSIQVVWLRIASFVLAILFYWALGWFARSRVPAFQRQIDALSQAQKQS